MKLALVKGTTSYRAYIFIQDSSVTTGAGLTGLVFNSSGLVASYVRPGAARTAITLATQTVTGAYSSGGFVEVDATNMPGVYRFDIPDAALASGVNAVVVMLKGATNMAPVLMEVQLTDFNLNTANVTLAAATHTGAVIPTVTTLTNLPAITTSWLTAAGIAAGALDGKGDWNIGKTGYSLTQAFPSNFAALSITAGGLVDITQAAADKAWSTAVRLLTAGTNIVLAKGVGVTGFNDLSAAQVNAEVDTALDTAVPGSPTADSINERVKAIDDKLPAGTLSDFDESADQVIVTTNNDKTGYALAADIRLKKNTAFSAFPFAMFNSTDHVTPQTGLTITAERSLDGAAFAGCANAVVEIANGAYKIDLAASDLNGDSVILRFTASGADDLLITLLTQTE